MKKRIIIVEDDVLVGIDLAEQLIDDGFHAVGPFVTVSDAFADFRSNGCDAAVLDVNLGKETSERFAEMLRMQSIPFVVLSGYSREQHPVGLLGEPSIKKPVHLPDLVGVLNGML